MSATLITPSTTLPSGGSGIPHALACQAAWQSGAVLFTRLPTGNGSSSVVLKEHLHFPYVVYARQQAGC